MTSKEKVKLGVAAGLLLVAIALFVLLAPHKGPIPNTDDAKTIWYCAACKSGFELTGAQTSQMVHNRRVEPTTRSSADSVMARRPGRTDIEVARCPFCGAWAGVAARRCPDCGEVFAARTKDGETAICPGCEWDPVTGKKAAGTRERLAAE